MSTYKSLSTANLPDPVIDPAKGESPTDYFNTVIWTGNGTSQSITGVGHQTDWVWAKCRSLAVSHIFYDVIRGVTKRLIPDRTEAEETQTNHITSFDSDGFSLGNSDSVNKNATTYVGWSWKAGGTGVSNTDGSITSTVSANTESGFSIVSYTGNDAASATVGHGLSQQAPEMVIVKNRQEAISNPAWPVYHSSLGATKFLDLQTTAAQGTATSVWNDTAPTSSLVTIGTADSVNSGSTHIMYCFHSVDGFSRIGSYTGNGSADGPFVYTGFRPAFLLLKNINSSTRDWNMLDSTINDFNVADNLFYPNGSNAELTSTHSDFLSNGFKIRNTGVQSNGSGNTMIYMAFAENPFKYSNAR